MELRCAAACSNLGALPTSGGTMSGAVDMGSNKISNLATPKDDSGTLTATEVTS